MKIVAAKASSKPTINLPPKTAAVRRGRRVLRQRGGFARLRQDHAAGSHLGHLRDPARGARLRPAVIEGDIAGSIDAERMEALGVPVVQINTEGACHLDANMTASAAAQLDSAGR